MNVAVQDVQMRVPLYSLEDIARIKDALAIEGETELYILESSG